MNNDLKNFSWKKFYFFFLTMLSCAALIAANNESPNSSEEKDQFVPSHNSEATSEILSALPSLPTFVPVSSISNKADPTTGLGAVSYSFSIGQYDVTAQEYCDFLNAVARAGDPNHLYDPRMSLDTQEGDPAVASITRTIADDGLFTYAPIKGREKVPIVYVTIYSAARYCNWLQNGQLTIEEMLTATEVGSYDLTCNCNQLIRTKGAQYFLATDNEWYKAAYFNPKDSSYYTFPNRSYWSPRNSYQPNSYHNEANYSNYPAGDKGLRLTPAGFFFTSMSPCGAFDMGGNVDQWTESPGGGQEGGYVIKGGSWKSSYNYFGAANDLESSSYRTAKGTNGSPTIGFRIIKLGETDAPLGALTQQPDRWWLTPKELKNVGIATVAVAIIVPCIIVAAPEIAAATGAGAADTTGGVIGGAAAEEAAGGGGGAAERVIGEAAEGGGGRVVRSSSWEELQRSFKWGEGGSVQEKIKGYEGKDQESRPFDQLRVQRGAEEK